MFRIAKATKVKEPSLIVKPIGRYGGLDNLHITLVIVIALLFLLLLVVSFSKPILIAPTNNTTTTVGSGALHSQTQIKILAERALASYSGVNSSLAILPYISNISSMSVNYLPANKTWAVYLKAKNPAGGFVFTFGFLINDTNTSKITPLLQTPLPSIISQNRVVAAGVVNLTGSFACQSQSPMNMYWFVDPYAYGGVKSLLNLTALRQAYGTRLNATVKIVVGSDTQRISTSSGLANALYLPKYTFCASQQKNFSTFVSKLNNAYNGSYVPQSLLSSLSNSSGLNYPQLSKCVNASSSAISAHGLLAQLFNITQTPVVVVNCHFLTLPQTARSALCYTNSTLC